MSYDFWITDKEGDRMDAPLTHHEKGGTYVVGGTRSLEFNITFNYASHFVKAFAHEDGIKILNGMLCIKAIPLIVRAMRRLGDDTTSNYWDSTEGNAKKALDGLLHIAALGFDGVINIGW
jgi:hypothetical protein